MSIKELLEISLWKQVPSEINRLTKEASGTYAVIRELMPSLPSYEDVEVYYNPYKAEVVLHYAKDFNSDKAASHHIAYRQVDGVNTVTHNTDGEFNIEDPHVHVKHAVEMQSLLGPVASTMQLKPNVFNKVIGGPNPLISTLAGAGLGAAVGYGGGWLAEQLLPEKYFDKGRLRKVTSVLGGLAGSMPGLWWGLDNMRAHPDVSKRWNPSSWVSSYPWPKTAEVSESRFKEAKESFIKIFPKEVLELDDRWTKYADDTGSAFETMIPVDQFGRVIWNDLRGTGGFTPPPLAAATTGLVQAASLSQGGANLISPVDIARIGVGAGSGWLSGLVVGKTLGALAGLRPEAQETLQRTGIWAGILSNTVPLIFR